ncbi:DUF4347 domain-containing protein [Herbaspirillum sp. HC18]|nr:DUF4347 domain-containing protein [Herbaspirillum sp. HC18]
MRRKSARKLTSISKQFIPQTVSRLVCRRKHIRCIGRPFMQVVSVSDLSTVAAPFQSVPGLTVQSALAPPACIAREADPSLNNGRKEVAFIDTALDEYGGLIDDVRAGIEVVLLDGSHDGLAQMAAWAQMRSGYDALHVLSHGDMGRLVLGTACVNLAVLTERRSELAAIGEVLNAGGDVLLYGCRVAGGSSGQAFIAALARTMQADIAASANPTGPQSLGGDWVLEARIGDVADPLFGPGWAGYTHLLAAQIVMNTASTIYVRPGGISYTWTFGNGLSPADMTSYTAISEIDFHDVDFPPGTNDWVLTRGKFQYSTNGGSSWTDYAYPGNNINFVSVSGKIWRFVDNLAGDTTTTNNVGTAWRVAAYPGQNVSSGAVIAPDNAPTDLSTNKTYFLSGSAQGTSVATLAPTDTGQTTNGYWAIDSQSVPNLFTISYDAATGNTASLNIGSGTIPAIGQTATVTARYYDLYQTDSSGNPINGQGIAKTFTFTVMNNESTDLDFGNDLNVSTTAANDQVSPSVTTLSNGNFVAVWQSAGQGGESTSYNGIYGQIYSNTGTAVGSELAITTAGNSVDEITPVVTALNSGRFAVAYATATASNGLDIAYRIVEANGTLGTQQTANTTVTGDQNTPAIATLVDGTFVIAWATDGAIHAQKINADGTKSGSELTIDAGTADVNPALAALSNGAYVIAWGDGDYNIKAVVSTAASTVIDVTTDGAAASIDSWMPLPRVAGLTGGGFVVAWDSYANDATNWTQSDIFFRQYSNAGVVQGAAAQANSTSATNSYRYEAAVDALSGGGFVIAWQSDTGDYDQNGIFGRRFTSAGVAVDASDFEINKYRAGDQNSPAVTALASDAFATVWVDNTSDTTSAGIEGRVLNVTNLAPTLSTVGRITGVTEDTQKAIALSDLLGLANEADSDGTVTAFVVKAVSTGTLKIGASAGTATAWAAGTNDTIDATHSAYWTPAADANGSGLNAFTIVAKDNGGAESASAVQVKADVSAVNDAPVINNLSGDSSSFTPGTPEYVDAQPTIADAATITDDNANFNNGYLRITQTAGTANGSFSFDTSTVKSGADAASADGTIAAGETVYVDDGGSWVAVGTIDNAEDGQSGHGLKINFNANALNGNPNAGQMNAPAGIIGYLQYTSATIGSHSFNMVLNDGALSSTAAAFSMTGLGITGVTSSTANGTYKVGSIVNVKVSFNDTVTVAGGTPSLLLETGATDRAATYVSGSGSSTLTFEYTVQTGDNAADLDYASVTALALNGAAIRDAAGHGADLSLPAPGATGSLANGKAIVIDGLAPTDIALSAASIATSASSNAVVGTLSTTDATTGDSFTYTLVSGTGDTNNSAFNISGNSLRATNPGSLTPGANSVRVRTTDAAGNTYEEALSITATTNPTVAITTDKSTLKGGQTATITFTFSDAPTGFDSTDVTVTGGSISAPQVDSGNNKIYTATFTPTAGTNSLSASLSVGAGKFTDAGGNANIASTTNVSISGDTMAPTLTITSNKSTIKMGETATVTFTFSEDPGTSFAWDGTAGDVVVTGGTLGAISGTGTTRTATFSPTPATNNGTASITVAAGSYTDAAGNAGGAGETPSVSFDTKAPTVTDAQVSITGATGVGGTFKTGDTVTVTWDNTAVGDNNSDTATVTANFSQFGGGSAVAADNNNGIWSASYTIVAGNIDSGNRNVAVTATDNVGNSATFADTTNASVDNQAPTVSDARISIAGASGTGGTYKIGDVVTATWNNTAGGDNNSDIAAVSFDFSQFGGGSAVASTNNSGTWSATHTIVAGSVDASNLNVSAKATDDAGNSTTRTDSTNATVDNIRPSVSSIAVSGTPASNATEVDFTVTLNEAVTGLDTGDFTLTATGAAAGSIASITGSGSSYTVKVNGISGSGSLRLDLKGTGTGITDDAGNAVAGGFTSGSAHTSSFNTPPAISNLNGDSVALAAAGSSVKLDAGTQLAISDTELGATWNGATLTVQRTGTAIANDVFGFDTSGSPGFTAGAGVLQASGQTFATYTNANGVLSISFTGSGTPATKTLVEKVMQSITYRNDTPYGNATIRFALSDGTDTTNADVTVTSNKIYVDQTAYDTDGDVADGFNLVEALAAAGDGTTILIKDGNYRGQFVATKAVTIDAVNGAAGHVVLESPDRADLTASAQNTINGRERMPILDLRTSTPAQGTITVKNISIDGRYEAKLSTDGHYNGQMDQIGIAVYDTNAVIDNVKISHISTVVEPSGDYSGFSENFGIVAEGSSAGTPVSVTVKNSTIDTFQKTGILAWGPGLDVTIKNNSITGVGVHGLSNQNGMQIGSSGPRTGTTGVISDNTISGLDTNDPSYTATGILLRMSGAVEVFNNTLSAVRAPDTNQMVGVDLMEVSSPVNVHDNVFGNAHIGVQLESPYGTLYTASHTIANNNFGTAYIAVQDDVDAGAANPLTITANSSATVGNGQGYLYYELNEGDDSFTDTGSAPSLVKGGAGNDTLTGGSGNDTLEGGAGDDLLNGGAGNDIYLFAATGNGIDTISNFALGDAIRVTGRSATNGTIGNGNGSNVAANSIQVSANGGVTHLYIDTDGNAGAAELEILVTGNYSTADFEMSGTDIRRTPPVADNGPSTPSGGSATIDGVSVTTGTTSDAATGISYSVIDVPTISTTRKEDTSTQHGSLADIPVGLTDGNTKVNVTVSLPVGTGLRAEGPATLLNNQQALLDLIKRIESKTEPSSVTQKDMTGEGQSFLASLSQDTKLVTRTLVLTHDQPASVQEPIVITGSSFSDGASNTAVGLVIDARNLPAGTMLHLDNVDFASVVGATTLRGGEGKNYVVGDDAPQNIMLGPDDDELHGGGGNDTVGSAAGNDRIFGDDGDDTLFGGIGQDLLCGGSGNDTVIYDLSRADYTIERNGKIATVRSLKDPSDADTLVNVETIKFADTTVNLTDGFAPATTTQLVAGLYTAFYDRAPDSAGLQYWIAQASAGHMDMRQMAAQFAGIAKFSELYPASLSTAEFVAKIYQNILGIQGDQAGRAFWTKLIDAGLSRTEFVGEFVTSALNFDAGNTTVAGADLANATMAKNTLSNKVEVGLHFAAALADKSNGAVDSTAYKQAIEVLDKVTDASASVEDAVVRIDLIGGHTGFGSAVAQQGVFM